MTFKTSILTTVASVGLLACSHASVVLYYDFEQPASSDDQVGSADVTWGAGGKANTDSPLGDTLGSSFSSTGSASIAAQAHAPTIGTSDFSVSFWMKLPLAQSGGVSNGIVDLLDGSVGGGLQVLVSPSDNIALGVGAASFQNRLSTVALASGNFDTWTHIAITVDRDNANGITYYVNGTQLGGNQNPTTYSGTSIAANQDLQVASANALPLNGLLDDLAVYSVVLTPAQVASLAAGTETPLTVSPPDTPPSLPTGLVAISSNYKVDLSWTPNSESNVNEYWIYRKEDQGAFQRIGISSAAQYTDRAFSSGVQYTYYVVARNISNQESLASAEVLGSFTPPTAIDVSSSPNKPNIILVMSDDQGWGDTGYNGHAFVQTPSTDAMAEEGYVLNRFYAGAPVCSPTRASVLTGRSAIRTKVSNHGRYMRRQEMTLAEALKNAGYVTGIFGKTHIGSGQPDSPANPSAMGFDEWLVGLNFFDNNPYLSRNGVVEHITGKGSDITIDETIAFIGRHKDGAKPIFAISWFPSPHDPHVEVPDGPTLYSGESEAGYYREITLLDEGLGRLRQYLRDQNIHENTILWYCSDNGGLYNATSGGRGKKGSVYEGGLRVPGIIEWPGRSLKGSSNIPITTMDMYPTLLAMAGVNVENQLPLDGEDVSTILDGSANSRGPIGFWHSFQGGQSTYSDVILSAIMVKQQAGDPTPHNASRMKKDIDEFPQYAENSTTGWAAWNKWPWKLHHKDGGATYELYNLETDPEETTNLYNSAEHTAVRDTMKAELTAWRASVIRSINGADYGKSSLWLPMNRTEGLELFDARGPKKGDILNTPNNTSHWIAGKHNRAISLDGVDDQVSIDNSYYDAPVGANARTVSAWIKTTGGGAITSWGSNAGSGRSCHISLNDSGQLSLDVTRGSIVGQSDLRDGSWHHIAVVIPNDASPNTSEVTLYVDGSEEIPSSVTNAAIRTDNSEVKIGGVRSSNSSISIDEFRIAPVALNASEVLSEASATDQAAAAWYLQHYGYVTTGPIDWLEDTDNDGKNALSEYAFGSDPTVADYTNSCPLGKLNTNTDRLEITFTRRKTGTHDLSYEVMASDDLISWNFPVIEKSVTSHPDYDNSLFEQVTYETTSPLSLLSRLFMRVQISD